MSINAKVVLHSRGPNGATIATLQIRLPRFVLAQLNTHRAISKSARSSRAVPVATLIEEAETDPVVPLFWGKNRKGMQSTEPLDVDERGQAERQWLLARDGAVARAKSLMRTGAHKQIVNRVLEPYLWVDVVATATDWSNFFALRCDRHAQPEMQAVAVAMARALRDSVPEQLEWPQWHLPYVTPEERGWLRETRDHGSMADRVKAERDCLSFSVARCARVSYRAFDGGPPFPEVDIGFRERLERDGHWSPFEHQALCFPTSAGKVKSGNFQGFSQHRQTLPKSVHASFDYSTLDRFGEQGFIV